MDDRSFDNMVRELAAPAWSRRSLGLAIAGLALSLPMRGSESEAARRHQGGRGRRKHGRGDKNRNTGNRDKKSGKDGSKSPKPESCPADVFSLEAGRLCDDNNCSCGGICCDKGFACYIDNDLKIEFCCFDGADRFDLPSDAKYSACVADPSVCCCDVESCKPVEHTISPSRYRRNPR